MHRPLGVGDEDHAIRPTKDQLASGVVVNLTRDGVELQGYLHAANRADFERQEIEEDGSITLRGEGDHLAALTTLEVVVDPLQIGGLATQSGTVVDDLRVELAQRVIEENHRKPSTLSSPDNNPNRHPRQTERLAEGIFEISEVRKVRISGEVGEENELRRCVLNL